MKAMAKRVGELEATQGRKRDSLDHLTDAELEALAMQLIEQMQAQGLVLPPDWREQYKRSPIRFMQWVEAQAKELISCD